MEELQRALPGVGSGLFVVHVCAGVIEERDIKAFVIGRLRLFQAAGVVTKASLDTAIESGTLIVQVNALDSTQVDIVLPFSIVPPLAKFGVVMGRAITSRFCAV